VSPASAAQHRILFSTTNHKHRAASSRHCWPTHAVSSRHLACATGETHRAGGDRRRRLHAVPPCMHQAEGP
jgi:hypothetical protein